MTSGLYVPKSSGKPDVDLPYSRVKLGLKRHIMPPLMGLVVMFSVFGIFHAQYISGQIAYRVNASRVVAGTVPTPPPVIIDEDAPPAIIINKIGVDAPVVYDLPDNVEATFQEALQSGTVHYPETARPGERGNAVIFGHSSSPWWVPGDYKFVFSLLEKVEKDDLITVRYKGVAYTYVVEGTRIVSPTDISVLQPTDDYRLTLITCTPTGTNEMRLIVDAVQIQPVPPADEQTAPANSPVVRPAEQPALDSLPSQSPGLWQSLTSWL